MSADRYELQLFEQTVAGENRYRVLVTHLHWDDRREFVALSPFSTTGKENQLALGRMYSLRHQKLAGHHRPYGLPYGDPIILELETSA